MREFVVLGPDQYERGKRVLDKAKHPGFVGRELMYRCATRGIVEIAVEDGEDTAIVCVDHKHTIVVLSTIVTGRGRGTASALVLHVRHRAGWIKATADRVSFFERLGYVIFGAPEIGAAGKMATQLLKRDDNWVPPEGLERAQTQSIDRPVAKQKKIAMPEGRPTKRTPELLAQLTAHLETGATLALACQACGLDPTTLNTWRKDPDFAAFLEQTLAIAQINNLSRVQAGGPGWQGAAWILERRHPKRWGKRETVTVNHSPVERMSRDEVVEELRRLQGEIAGLVQ